MQSASRQASCRVEVLRRFLEWITGETSPTLYVSFGKRKRENTCACIIRAARVLFCIDNVQFDLCTDPRRRKRRTFLAVKSPGPAETTASSRFQQGTSRGNGSETRGLRPTRAHSYPDKCRTRSGRP